MIIVLTHYNYYTPANWGERNKVTELLVIVANRGVVSGFGGMGKNFAHTRIHYSSLFYTAVPNHEKYLSYTTDSKISLGSPYVCMRTVHTCTLVK